MSITHRVQRTLATAAAGAMVLSLMPVGASFAEEHDDPCDSAPETAFTDAESIAAVHDDNVQCMAAYGITAGLADGSFGPGQPVTRQQMASFISRLVTQATDGNLDIPTDSPAAFEDVPAGSTHFAAINWLADLGITTGVTATTYQPGENVSREQMASFIFRAHDTLDVFEAIDPPDTSQVDFSDIEDATDFHVESIVTLAALDVIGGFDDGTFRPGDDVTRQQMSRFIVDSIRVLDDNGLWNGNFIDPDPATFDLAVGLDPAAPTTADDLTVTTTLTADDEDAAVDYDVQLAIFPFTDDADDAFDDDGLVDVDNTFALESATADADGVATFEFDAGAVPAGTHLAVAWAQDEETIDPDAAIAATSATFTVEQFTNQTFSVAAAETVVPQDATVEFTADVGASEEVTIWLLDPEAVVRDATGGVTFNTDADGLPVLADGTTSAVVENARLTGVDDTVLAGNDSFLTVDVAATTSFEVALDVATREDVVAVVTDGPASTVLVDEGLVTDVDGSPAVAFGVSEDVAFADVADLASDEDEVDVELGTTASFEVSLVDAATPAEVVPADGQTIRYRVYDTSTSPAPTDWTTSDPDEDANFAFSGSETSADGAVTIAVDSGDAEVGDTWEVLVRWAGSGPFDGATPREISNPGLVVNWIEAGAVADISFTEEVFYLERDSIGAISAVVVDGLSEPVEGVTVQFDSAAFGLIDGQIRTTDADGVAALSFSVPDDGTAVSDIVATVVDQDDAPLDPSVDVGAGTFQPFGAAAADETITESTIIDRDTENGYVYIAIDTPADVATVDAISDVVRVDYTVADVWEALGVEVAAARWVEFLQDTVVLGDMDFLLRVSEDAGEYTHELVVDGELDVAGIDLSSDPADEVVVTITGSSNSTPVEGLSAEFFSVTVGGVAVAVEQLDAAANVYTLTIDADLVAGEEVEVTVQSFSDTTTVA